MVDDATIELGEHFSGFVERQVEIGRFGSASEVVQAGLKLLEEHEMRVKGLQNALIAGEKSGAPRSFDNEAFVRRMRQRNAR
ncbi:type II toxin-antitoxin system ParD family antitoxin [Neorhizobium lilium]|uniref:Type II toxin-antitoxin system ParD family antitoxin n=1 Tax=Neorhizobium lilium TaxID=2503024 RepID=A0A444LGP0_9HYPH|nr:type II toxin-antitoxin system ParD family antitoxin [Neorhizobium lilium]RWX77271.1 type II toxin-antitoxin system ParD family antitoxin [Neorhizobium lilium]